MFKRKSFHLFPEDDDHSAAAPEQHDTEDSGTHRPARLCEIIGQPQLTKRLTTHVGYAIAAGQQPGHILIDGPSGYGKTSIASTIAQEITALGVPSRFHEIIADQIEHAKGLALLLSAMHSGDVFFIDEIHTLRRSVALALYKALEDGTLSLPRGAEPVPVPKVTVVGATTHPGKVPVALRNRFTFTGHVEPYSLPDLTAVLIGYAARAGVDLTYDAAQVLAKAARFTPRLAIGNLNSVRAYAWEATLDPDAKIDDEVATEGLEYAEIDPYGLNARDHRVLTCLVEQFAGGPVELKPLTTALGMELSELTNDVLGYLVQAGVWRATGRGQCATKGTYRVLGLPIPPVINGNF